MTAATPGLDDDDTGRLDHGRRGRRRRLIIVLAGSCLLIALLVLLIVRAIMPDAPRFPHEIPHTTSDVSYQKAFHDHAIVLPTDARELYYWARADVDGYPVSAYFTIDCSDIARFSQVNSLNPVLYGSLPDGALYVLAGQHGWNPKDTAGVYWYQRPLGPSANLEAMIDPSKTSCEVYLSGIDPATS